MRLFSGAIAAAAIVLAAGGRGETCIYDSFALDGAWEMSYRPNAWETEECPKFDGARVEKAVPGFWEDMIPAFRAAGIKDEFKINPGYARQKLPIYGRAKDTTLPNISGCFLYRRSLALEKTPQGAAFLAFDCVRNQVHVWVNGKFAGFRAGFSTPFELPVPDGLLKRGENEIVLAVSNNPNKGYNGKDVSGLTTRQLFESTGGIDGRVELRFAKNALRDVYVTTAADLKSFTVHASAADKFKWEIRRGETALKRGEARGDFTLPTDGFEFWSPENPVRYTLALTTPEGVYTQKFGIRRLTVDGERLKLNGKFTYLRGITEHCYFAETVHLPRDREFYRAITKKRKELGFNFLRFHTYVPPAEYLEAMDELGMMVHIESPNFVTLDEYRAIVGFARKHPSVVAYCTGNETMIDGGAEKYLKAVADIVHGGTDSLFTPMSAMRRVEYVLGRGKLENRPFKHNAAKMKRLAEFCDYFTSYQLGAVSYNSLNGPSAAEVDKWGDAYCGKPRVSHEICIDGSFCDITLEKDYPDGSPIVKTGVFSEVKRHLAERGLLDRAPAYVRNSCEWMRRIRKFTFEKVRSMRRTTGYDYLGDIDSRWHTFGYSDGMMDEFFRLKHGESVENILRYNSAAVLLCDLGSDFNVKAGEKKRVAFSLSNFAGDAKDATLRVSLAACPGGDGSRAEAQSRGECGGCVWSGEKRVEDVKNGEIAAIGEFDIAFPAVDKPAKYLLRATFSGGAVAAANEWEIYAFPEAKRGVAAPRNLRIADDISRDDLLAAMERGERVLLLGKGPFKALSASFRIGLAGRPSGNYATIIKSGHPALAGLPHDGFCGWQFRRLMEDAAAVQLEAGVPFDPIVEVASSDKFLIRQSMMFEYKVGEGRLLVCSFNFDDSDPAAAWLKARLAEYAGSDAFEPALSLSKKQLAAVIDAPLLKAEKNSNVAANPNDPANKAAPKQDGDCVMIKSSFDGTMQPCRFYAPEKAATEEVPLIVALHTWSYSWRDTNNYTQMLELAKARGWAMVGPDFRGANKTPPACAGDAAVQDIVDAVEYAKTKAKIDPARIYIAGGSGGGHMTLVMAGRHPEIWAGCVAFCPISDLARWHADSMLKHPGRNRRYAGMMEKCCGGTPEAKPDEYRRRSPLAWLDGARKAGVPVYIATGIHDGWKGSVPVGHAIRAFNALADAKDRIPEADIAFVEKRQAMPPSLAGECAADPFYVAKGGVHFRRASANALLTIFEGGHDSNFPAGFEFLSRQRKGAKADFSIPDRADGTSAELTK